MNRMNRPTLLVFRGLPGSGKSTLARALGRRLGWVVLDKDDIKDVLDGEIAEAGALAYEIMWRVAGTQLDQGLSIICDSPLSQESYDHALVLAHKYSVRLLLLECQCTDEVVWRQRLDQRKDDSRYGAHRICSWEALKRGQPLRAPVFRARCPHLVLDTTNDLEGLVALALQWLETQSWVDKAHQNYK